MSKTNDSTIWIATRGSALALAQANQILELCREACSGQTFELRIIKTTGDKNLKASLANPGAKLPKGLFTKELEVALLEGEADLAVHSLKDLPTELPEGLMLGATTAREDPRDVLVFARERAADAGEPLGMLPRGATVGTSSNRRKAQLLHLRPDLNMVEIRGNVGTRLRKVVEEEEDLHATLLAAAGMKRLGFGFHADGSLSGPGVPQGIGIRILEPDEMLPAVGQAAIGIEIREADERIAEICSALNHAATLACVRAERAFLAGIGGGCATPAAAHARIAADRLRLDALSFLGGDRKCFSGEGEVADPEALGKSAASELSSFENGGCVDWPLA